MYRSLYFKIILIFVVLMVTVMAVVGTVLLNGVFQFYTDEFVTQIDQHLNFDADLRRVLIDKLNDNDYVESIASVLESFKSSLGIDIYRNYYILTKEGLCLYSSDTDPSQIITITPNILSAMDGKDGKAQLLGAEYTDYAVYIENDNNDCIIYIKDTQEEMRQLSLRLFLIILQTIVIGLVIAVILSFFLAKAITSPIQSLTKGAQLITAGKFTENIDVRARDEIGILTVTFNNMNQTLKDTIEELLGERQKLETILVYLKDGVIAFNEIGKVIHINKSALELLDNIDAETFELTHLLTMLKIQYAYNNIKEVDSDHSYILHEVEYKNKALDITVSTLKYADKNMTRDGYIVVIHDVSSRYELEKAQRTFVADVSHELRTPLTSIRSSIESIQLYPDMDIKYKDEFLGNAIEECDRMLRIIGELLSLSKLENKKEKWQISSFNVNDFLNQICNMMRIEAESHNLELTYMDNDKLPWILADKDKIKQVIINIIANSIRYSKDSGNVIVAARANDVIVRIFVRDNGIGIPEEDLPHIFERFYRVEKSRTTDTGGTGLGLAIAKGIVEAHGGTITIKSKVGIGTDMIIDLPIITELESDEDV